MEELREIAGPPAFYDWSGTAVMLQDIAHGMSFEELAGLDRNRWAVAAVDLGAGNGSGARSGLVVYAIDLRRWGGSDPEQRRNALAQAVSQESVGVTRLIRPDLGIGDVLAQMKTASVRFRSTAVRDVRLSVLPSG
jgi:hypothetical protein